MLATLRNLEKVQLFEPSTLLTIPFYESTVGLDDETLPQISLDYLPHHYEKLGGFVLMHSHLGLQVYSLHHTSSGMDSLTILL